MKIVRINALWCSACLYMKKIWKEIEKKYPNLDIETYDYDMDDIKKYNPGEILPIIIFYKNGIEYKRLVGEHREDEIINIMKECQ